MANTFGTLALGILLQRGLELTFTKRPLLKAFTLNTRDLDGSAARVRKGQSVTTRKFAVATVGDFGAAASERNDADVAVTLSDHKQLLHTFTTAEQNQTDRNLIDESTLPMQIGLQNHIVDTAATKWTAANFPTGAVTKGAGWDYNHLVAVRKVLQQRGVPEGQRYYICNSDVYASLLTDPMIVAEFNNAANQEAIRSGNLPTVAGLMIAEYPDLPTNGENLIGFAGSKDAIILAQRGPQNPEDLFGGNVRFPGNLAYIQEPLSGFTVMVNEFIEAVSRNANVRLDWLQGFNVGNANNGIRIKSA